MSVGSALAGDLRRNGFRKTAELLRSLPHVDGLTGGSDMPGSRPGPGSHGDGGQLGPVGGGIAGAGLVVACVAVIAHTPRLATGLLRLAGGTGLATAGHHREYREA